MWWRSRRSSTRYEPGRGLCGCDSLKYQPEQFNACICVSSIKYICSCTDTCEVQYVDMTVLIVRTAMRGPFGFDSHCLNEKMPPDVRC